MPSRTARRRPVRTKPFPPLPPRFGGRELEYLREALERNNLFYWQKDGFTHRMLERVRAEFGAPFAVSASSGTAALHVAIGGVGVRPGAEVITSPITDMGSLIPILYQNAVPVFADVDPHTYNMTAETIRAAITERTEAVILVHLAGNPAEVREIADLCRTRGIGLVEDVAQSYGCRYDGKHVGGFGDCGCFSLNHYKHLSCGDGGFLVTADENLFYRCHDFADKCYDRHDRGVRLSFLAPNYRMTELQAAVALAQFDRLEWITTRRNELGTRLTDAIGGIPGIHPPRVPDGGWCSYWFYMLRIDPEILGTTREAFADGLRAEGIPAGAGYIPRPMYREDVFQSKRFFPGGRWPAEQMAGREYDYRSATCPVAERVLETAVVLPLHEGYETADVDDYAEAIRRVACP